jgi:hypothetical protein
MGIACVKVKLLNFLVRNEENYGKTQPDIRLVTSGM